MAEESLVGEPAFVVSESPLSPYVLMILRYFNDELKEERTVEESAMIVEGFVEEITAPVSENQRVIYIYII